MDMRCVEFFKTLKDAREFIHTITWKASIKITREPIEYTNKYMFAVWFDAPENF